MGDLSRRTASFAPRLCCAASPLRDGSQEPAPGRGGPTREVGIFSLFRPGSEQGRDELIPAGSRALTVFLRRV